MKYRTGICSIALCMVFLLAFLTPTYAQQTGSGTKTVSIDEPDPIANPQAVKGGSFSTWGGAWPKSINYWLYNSTVNAEIASFLFDNLVSLHPTKNQPLGILATSWTVSEDKKTFTFNLDPNAKWSDGKPVTAEDVQFYYDVIMDPKNMTSLFRVDLKRLDRPQVIDAHTIKVTANTNHWANFWTAGGLTAFPKHIWKSVDFNRQNFDFPVVSGPYKIQEVKENRYISLERRKDWWGESKKFNQFKYNFTNIKYKFMEDRTKALEALKTQMFDVLGIYTSSIWMKQTDFNEVQKGWIVKQRVSNQTPQGFQGIAINMRKPQFQDIRVRQALCLLFNRSQMIEKLMYNQYKPLNTYFPDLYPNKENPSVPVTGFAPDQARKLLEEAGWTVDSDGLLKKNSKPFTISLIEFDPDLRFKTIYIEDLKKVGITVNVEMLSLSTIQKRLDNKDFDIHEFAWADVRLRDPEAMWLSSTADETASQNYPGVKDSLIDRLIEQQKTELSLDKRNEICRQIDKRLSEIVPYILEWSAGYSRLLYWNRFGTPKYILDKYGSGETSITTYWWLSPDKEKELNAAMKSQSNLPLQPQEIKYQE